MTTQPTPLSAEQVEILEGQAASLEQLARVCCVSQEWLEARIEAEVLPADWRHGTLLVSSETVWRVRQIAALEHKFDADPHLAGLVTDLMVEVRTLRRELKRWRD